MLQISFNIAPKEDGVIDGRELARGLIENAFELLVPYVDGCPACADALFTVLANEALAAAHATGRETGSLPSNCMVMPKDGVNPEEAMTRHLRASTETTQALLEKAAEQHQH